MKTLKNGKAGGIDDITAELLNAVVDTSKRYLTKISSQIWTEEKIPSQIAICNWAIVGPTVQLMLGHCCNITLGQR